MQRASLTTMWALALALAACTAAPGDPAFERVADPLPYADPFMGSGGFAFGAGSAYPGAAAANGVVKVGPDTVGPYGDLLFLHYSGYWYGDDTVQGFSHLHLAGTGATDYGVLSVMPIPAFDPARLTVQANQARFDKASERASPGYYSLTLENGIKAEFTATHHVAHHRYGYPEGAGRFVLVDLGKHLSGGRVTEAEATLVPEARRVFGRLHHIGGMSGGFDGYDVYFEIVASSPWRSARVWKKGAAPAEGLAVAGEEVGLVLEFDAGPVELRVSPSFLSNKGAARNIADEMPVADFEKSRAETEASWRRRLGTVVAYGGSEARRRMLYSAIHHLYVMPSITCDTDGYYLYRGKKGYADGYRFVSDLSLWDTYRTLNPLYSLIAPDKALDVVRSLEAMAELGGFFPLWPIATGESGVMLGASADVVIADAYLRGVRGFDVTEAWGRLRAAALDPAAPAGGRGGRNTGFEHYSREGYVPVEDSGRSVSHTIEFAHDDFALSNLAAALGHADDAKALLERSRGYRKLWDPETAFLRARKADGTLRDGPFDPFSWDDYAEANAWHSVWGAPHDVEGLVALFGSREAALAKLEAFFELARLEDDERREYAERYPDDVLFVNRNRPYFWAANEPDIHTPFMFAQLGRPDLTQKWLPWVRDSFFAPTPEGLPGNDDGGTMSAWWVWSALGFYPLAGSDRYIVGAPLFPKLELQVAGGVFTIDAPAVSDTNVYVQSVTLNGAPLERPEFRHEAVRAGGVIRFEMGPAPSSWGR